MEVAQVRPQVLEEADISSRCTLLGELFTSR
jgi:hypothetical protein